MKSAWPLTLKVLGRRRYAVDAGDACVSLGWERTRSPSGDVLDMRVLLALAPTLLGGRRRRRRHRARHVLRRIPRDGGINLGVDGIQLGCLLGLLWRLLPTRRAPATGSCWLGRWSRRRATSSTRRHVDQALSKSSSSLLWMVCWKRPVYLRV